MLKFRIYPYSYWKPKIVWETLKPAPVPALKEHLLTHYKGNVTFKNTGTNDQSKWNKDFFF